MFKKLVIASAVLAASSSIVLAGQTYKGDYKGEMAAPAPCPTYNLCPAPYVGVGLGVRNNYTGDPVVFKGLDGDLFAGYGGIVAPSFYLAGEAFVLGTANLKDYQDFKGNGARSTWSYGLSVIPGYMITDHVLGYLRAGAAWTRFSDQNVSNKVGGQIGVGGQTNIYQNWDLRGEYVYTQYGRVTGIGKVQNDLFNVGLVYRIV